MKIISVNDNEQIRIDSYLSPELEMSRSRISELIKSGHIKVNGENTKASYKVQIGDKITAEIPEPEVLDILPEQIELDIIYEDADIIAINKAKGMIVHPSGNIVSGTLVNAIMHYSDELSEINGVLRPGIVHRLDKDTSGIILIAKNQSAHINLQEQFKSRDVKKEYVALVNGGFKEDTGEIVQPIARDKRDRKKMAVDPQGRYAHTKYEVVSRFGNYTLLKVDILTGRTHQIRVHMAHIKHPIVGDTVYSSGKNEFGVTGQLLHSESIVFSHPRTGERMTLSAPIPEEFEKVIEKLNLTL